MKHTEISKKKFETELEEMTLFSERGARLSEIRGQHNFRWDEFPRGNEQAVHHRFRRTTSNGQWVGHSYIQLGFQRSRNVDVLVRPKPRIMLCVVEVDSFTPEPLIGLPLPKKEAARFGENRVEEDAAGQKDDVGWETLVLRLALEEILRAIERSVIR